MQSAKGIVGLGRVYALAHSIPPFPRSRKLQSEQKPRKPGETEHLVLACSAQSPLLMPR
jgi:hypothetical protein